MINAIAPWYGSNRLLAPHVGKHLAGLDFVAVPFAGGMAEVKEITARTVNVNDRHSHVINLAAVLADDRLGPQAYRKLRRVPFHPKALSDAQAVCLSFAAIGPVSDRDRLDWAVAYFVAAWMPRHGSSGTAGEFYATLSTRWGATGGDSARHYWSAVESIRAWRAILQRCNFTNLDAFDALAKCVKKDNAAHGVYCDPPFPGPGDKYAHNCGNDAATVRAWHTRLRDALESFQFTRVVCRYYDHPLVRELYGGDRWQWVYLDGRKQTNDAAPEVLLVLNGKSAT